MSDELIQWFRNGGECAERGEECRVRDVKSGCTCTAAADTITALRAEVELLEHRRRWNVEERLNGRIGVCRQMHEKHEPCEYEEYAPVAEVERLRAALELRQDAEDTCLEAVEHVGRYNSGERIAEAKSNIKAAFAVFEEAERAELEEKPKTSSTMIGIGRYGP